MEDAPGNARRKKYISQLFFFGKGKEHCDALTLICKQEEREPKTDEKKREFPTTAILCPLFFTLPRRLFHIFLARNFMAILKAGRLFTLYSETAGRRKNTSDMPEFKISEKGEQDMGNHDFLAFSGANSTAPYYPT